MFSAIASSFTHRVLRRLLRHPPAAVPALLLAFAMAYQQEINLRLISLPKRLQPLQNVRIQAHGYRLLRWPVKFSDLGPAPIDHRREIREINIRVFFCCDDGDVSLLLLGELPHSCKY